MDLYVTVNPTGTKGGGIFRDTHMEHSVRAVKSILRGTHGNVDDIKLEKEVGGLSVITELTQHYRRSALRGKTGKEHCKDMVGQEVRDLLEENASKYDPFSKTRNVKYKFHDRPTSSPFEGLTLDILERFTISKRR